jgi:hypothetical protein
MANLYAKEARELKEEERRARQAWLKKIKEEEEREIFTDVLTELISLALAVVPSFTKSWPTYMLRRQES